MRRNPTKDSTEIRVRDASDKAMSVAIRDFLSATIPIKRELMLRSKHYVTGAERRRYKDRLTIKRIKTAERKKANERARSAAKRSR